MAIRLYVRFRQRVLASPLGGPLRRLRQLSRLGRHEQDARDNAQLRGILAAVLEPDSNCIDVGAHHGSLLVEMTRLAPTGRHVAFEPIPALAAELGRQFPGVEVREVALSDRVGQSTFFHVVTRPGFSGLRQRKYPRQEEIEEIRVDIAPLDDVLPADYSPDFIKIDVEGAEYEVLRGAVATIDRHRPIITFEHELGAADYYGTRPEQIFDLLVDRLRMAIFDVQGDGPYDRDSFIATFASHQRVNFLAKPVDRAKPPGDANALPEPH